MGALFPPISIPAGRTGLAMLTLAFVWPLLTVPVQARGPEAVADVAEQVIDAVVNISTKQTVDMSAGTSMPQLPPGSPFEEFFEEFFKNRRGQGAPNAPGGPQTPRRVN